MLFLGEFFFMLAENVNKLIPMQDNKHRQTLPPPDFSQIAWKLQAIIKKKWKLC